LFGRLSQVFAKPWVIAQQRDLMALLQPSVPSPLSEIFCFFYSVERRVKRAAISFKSIDEAIGQPRLRSRDSVALRSLLVGLDVASSSFRNTH